MMQYRKATMDDLPAIHALVQAAIARLQADGNMQWDERYPTDDDFIPDILSNTQYVGIRAGEIVLVFALNTDCDPQYAGGEWRYPDQSWAVLHRFILRPDCQGKGLSKKALGDVIAMLRENGVQNIRLDVYTRNRPAQALYRGFGFVRVGECTFRDKFFDLMELHLENQ